MPARAPAAGNEAVLQNNTLQLRFQSDGRGVRLASIINRATGREYLHGRYNPASEEGLPPPSIWEGRAPGLVGPPEKLPGGSGSFDASNVGNPFYIIVERNGKTEAFNAPTDFDLLSWTATTRTLTARLRGRGLFVEATLRVAMAPDRSYWNLDLHSLSGEPLYATVGFPAFARLIVDGPRLDRAIVPWGSGAVLRDPAMVRWRATYGEGLSAPFALWSGAGEGLFVVDNSRGDLESAADTAARRDLQIGPGAEAPADSGPSLSLEYSIRLPKGGDMTLGPVVVGAYRGDSGAGAAAVAQVRAHILHMPRTGVTLARLPVITRGEGRLSGLLVGTPPPAGSAVLLAGFSGARRGDYLGIPDDLGGSSGLKKAIEAAHAAGLKVFLEVDGARVSKDSVIGKADGAGWAVMGRNGKPVEEGGDWVLCPADEGWRDWLAGIAVRLLRTFGADGIAVAGLANAPSQVCIARDHGHSSPYAWTWGIHRLFQDLRERLDRDVPGAALVCEGALDEARESADALVAQTHELTGYRFEYPLLRAVYPNIRVYESAAAADPALAERLAAWNAAWGLPVYAPSAGASGAVARRAFAAYSEAYDGTYAAVPPTSPSRDVVAQVLVGQEYLLSVCNLGDDAFTGRVRLPFRASMLEDRLTGLWVPPDADGSFTLALLPRQAAFWHIIVDRSPGRQPATSLSAVGR